MEEKNAVVETILNRRSVRNYKDDPIPKEFLHTVLKCGLYAPSGKNCQFSRFIVFQNKDVLKVLNQMVGEELAAAAADPGTPIGFGAARAREGKGYPFFNRVPALVIVVSKRDYATSMANSACALMNMQIAAEALGLASCWRNQLRWLKDSPKIRSFLRQYGMNEDEEVFGSLQLGYSAERNDVLRSPRKPGRVVFDDGREWVE